MSALLIPAVSVPTKLSKKQTKLCVLFFVWNHGESPNHVALSLERAMGLVTKAVAR